MPAQNLGESTLVFDSANLGAATTVSLDGGTTFTSFSVLDAGLVSPKSNNNFFKDFDEFSADDPPFFAVIEVGTVQYIFFTDSPTSAGRLSGNIFLDGGLVICFEASTEIMTDQGARAVSDLKPGDRVLTRDHGWSTVRWAGQRTVAATEALAPVTIHADAFGPGRPSVDIRVSPWHRILVADAMAELLFGVSEALAPALWLVNDRTITRDRSARFVTYAHILCDDHEIVYTSGLMSETLHPGHVALGTLSAQQRAEIEAIFPELFADGIPAGASLARRSLTGKETRVLQRTGR
ncbi:Hint domain-containing protein [Roseicyclus persicicus]|uniref:Hint domain-containing protein n=1 Tax=Roseicyclus persicicus TaxID=2650661 RepID=A0A7X6JXE2_9RHOB|nr:Hint domain-containing protein [Roseibacterium persicicum]NKX42970.1 Hint domain-containing protein [Roseibacterium persicicum]